MVDNLSIGYDPDIIILGVDFSDDYEVLSIRYVESRNVAPNAWKKEEVTVARTLLDPEEFPDFMESLQHFLDVGLRDIRVHGGKSPGGASG